MTRTDTAPCAAPGAAPEASAGKSRYRSARSVADLTQQNVEAIAALEREARESRGMAMKIATRIATACGTLSFALIHVVLFAAWIALNTLPGMPHIDPYPYTFLTLLLSMEAIFLSTFILMAANEEARLTDRRNALDLQINLLTEQENTKMLRILQCIARKVEAQLDDDPAVAALEQATRPEQLARQIDRVIGGK